MRGSVARCRLEPRQPGAVDRGRKNFNIAEGRLAGRLVAVEKANAVELGLTAVALRDELSHQLRGRKGLAAHHVGERKPYVAIVGAVDQLGADEFVSAEEIKIEIVGLA